MPYTGYAFTIAVCIIVGLVASSRIRERWYPFALYGTGLGLVLITTLAGPYLIGSDIHLEYYYAQLRAGKDVWAPLYITSYGTSVLGYVSSWIWTFKVIYPLLFALVPVILYKVFQKWLTPQQSFLASFLFIALPTFFMELPSISKEMIAELVLAALLFFLIKSSLSLKRKLPALVILGALIPLIHYSVAMVSVIIFGVGFLVGLILKNRMWKTLGATLAVIILASSIYFPLAEQGAVALHLGWYWNHLTPQALHISINMIPQIQPEAPNPLGVTEFPGPRDPLVPPPEPTYINKLEALMQAGLGADFMRVNVYGKMFRSLQWGILVLIGIGLWRLRKNKGYWVVASGAILILLLCLVPGWASILNTTRFMHLSLFLIAPAFAVALKPKYLLIILISYFLFTSGFIFEITKQPNVESITIPYSIGLSDHRMDLGATFTKDDVIARQYIIDNNLFPINSDVYGSYFFSEKVGQREDLNWALPKTPVPLRGYIFVRSRSTQDGTLTIWNGVGCRRFVDPSVYGIDFDENVIFQSGDSKVLEVK